MTKLIAVGLFLNAVLLAGHLWQGFSASAEAPPSPIGNGDVDASGVIDISDASYLLNWLFLGGNPPVACAQGGGVLTPEQERILDHLSIVELADGQGGAVETLRLTGANFQIVNGTGSTETYNGTGNIIVGYQEPRFAPQENDRRGSHNIVVGSGHNYLQYGGLVVGIDNTIGGAFASVHGGAMNTADGDFSAVIGGMKNITTADSAIVSGGTCNTASGAFAVVSGGEENTASEEVATVSGGSGNRATGRASSVSGGTTNEASGDASTVSGGQLNSATGVISTVSGGGENLASGFQATVSGGNGFTGAADNSHAP